MQSFMHKNAVPVSPLVNTYPPYAFPLVAGEGDRVVDPQGNTYLDFYGGHCVASTGHCHPAVVDAIAGQARKLMFYSAAARLPVRDEAAAALVEFAGNGMASVFFCNSGAEANENALHIALKLTGRRKFVAFQGAFHGRTLLALSVTDSVGLRQGCESLLAPTTFLPFGDEAALDRVSLSGVAAVIVEPMQSMAGVKTAAPAWFAALRDKCSKAGALLVFDEIQTGMGRLGAPFAANRYAVTPDLITCAKGMASGVPMGAVLMTGATAAELHEGDLGSTFGGGPLACAALLATLDVVSSERLMHRALAAEARIRSGLETGSIAVRGSGLLLGLEVGARAGALRNHLLERRILVGGSGDSGVLRLMPPLNVGNVSVDTLIEAVHEFCATEVAS